MDGASNTPQRQPVRQAQGRPHPRQANHLPAKLSTLFTRNLERDDAQTEALWRRHFNGDAEADHALFLHYAPMIRVLAFHLQGIRPDFFSPDIDDLMSDGAMGLLNAIRLSREGAMGFRFLCGREIKKAMFREEQTRRWGGRRRCEKIAVTRRIHAELTSTLGRLPTPEEMFERLKGLIGNPQLFVHGEQHVYSLSQSPREEGRPTQVAGDFPTPVERAIVAEESNQRPVDSEAIRLAGKKLDNRDRKILKALLAGQTAKEIAERFGLGYEGARNRINGILWVCRCNADLAAYLGVEAAEMPERKQGHMPWFPIPSGVLAG